MRRVICVVLIAVLMLLGIPGVSGIGQVAAQAETPHIVQIATSYEHSLALFSEVASKPGGTMNLDNWATGPKLIEIPLP